MSAQKTIVFDWNGTLLDDTAHVLECVNLALASVGQAPVNREQFSDGHHWPLKLEEPEWPLRSFYRGMGLNDEQLDRLRDNERSLFHDSYEALSHQTALRPGAEEILKYSRASEIHSLILSNHLVDEIRKQLERFGIEPYFADVLAYANREIQFKDMTKGERLRRFMARENLKPENMIIVGDTIEEILIARELGLASIAITGGTITEERLRSENPDHLIHSLHELKPIMQEQGIFVMSLASVIERSRSDKEAWKYTSLAPLAAQKFMPAKAEVSAGTKLPSIVGNASERHQIVFLNGIWRPESSKLGELEGILRGDAQTGYRLVLAGQTCLVTAPVELVFVNDAGAEPAEINLKLDVELGASGRLTLIELHVASNRPAVFILETAIRLGPQAKLVHGKVIDSGAASLLARTNIEVGEGGYYDNFALIESGKLVRNEIEVGLGQMAQCALNGVMLLGGDMHADTTTHIIHAAPFGTSRETYKSVVTGKARGVFQGKVTVEEAAQKTDAQQMCRALLLSDQAEMDAKPELKIYADDVKCSHGAAVGALDNDALFYLRARGIDEAARALLIRGFIGETIGEIQMPEWHDYVKARAEAWCDEQN